jgi:2-hydroxychromene-2-carboxylate isomerase
VLPPAHPFNPLHALRAVVARPSIDLVDALFAAAWIEGRAIDTPEAVSAIASAIGEDGPALERDAASDDVKRRLREETEAATTRGIFGVPTLELDGELFWGSDAIEHADAFLRGEDPVPSDPRYFDRPVAATRAAKRETKETQK